METWKRALAGIAIAAAAVQPAAGQRAGEDDFCRMLEEILSAPSMRTWAGVLEKSEYRRPTSFEGFEIEGAQMSEWAAKRSLPGFFDCTGVRVHLGEAVGRACAAGTHLQLQVAHPRNP